MYVQTRKIKPTRRSVSGIFPFRGIDSIPFESTLERDFLIRTEHNPFVTKIVAQPAQIPFIGLNGRTYTYTPDFLVYFENQPGSRKPMLVEVKPQEALLEHWEKLRPKLRAGFRYAKLRDWNFRIYNENRIRDQFLENIKFLNGYKRRILSSEKSQLICSTLKLLGPISITDLVDSLTNSHLEDKVDQLCIWQLLAFKHLGCDLGKPLSPQTMVWISSQESCNE
ncbi:TnsA endonuclease N-terminal domain-containing protein [Methylobacter sp.]|uniref:TnsA endonuclease N-terminal domain-containing protein n=1 Tax=Methylobacter sp. TaxID=2051955 RepID=UPI003522D41B